MATSQNAPTKPWVWLVFPAAHLIYTQARGWQVDWYPYPFLNLRELGFVGVSLTCVSVALIFGALAYLVSYAGNKLAQRNSAVLAHD